LDVFTVHCYPQGGEGGGDISTTIQLKRNRSTRSLWDTNYVDESWINDKVMLIPRMKGWVAQYYPGTKVGITEYNWGAEANIGGATAQADILGIFGREGLDLGTRWTTPPTGSPVYHAIMMFRNYDGNKASFGDQSVHASTPNPDNVSVFAATRSSDGALTMVLINKQLDGVQPVQAALSNYAASGPIAVWQLDSANVIRRLADATIASGKINLNLPAQSVTLLEAHTSVARPKLNIRASSSPSGYDLWVAGLSGQTYVVEAAANLASWRPIRTNTIASNTNGFAMPIDTTPAENFFRAVANQ
jgi:hypothetical protein